MRGMEVGVRAYDLALPTGLDLPKFCLPIVRPGFTKLTVLESLAALRAKDLFINRVQPCHAPFFGTRGTPQWARLHLKPSISVGREIDITEGMESTRRPCSPEFERLLSVALLNDAEWAQWSGREIARRCGVNPEMPGKLRPFPSLSVTDSETRKFVSKHGTTTTMKTDNIGRRKGQAGARFCCAPSSLRGTEPREIARQGPANLARTPFLVRDRTRNTGLAYLRHRNSYIGTARALRVLRHGGLHER